MTCTSESVADGCSIVFDCMDANQSMRMRFPEKDKALAEEAFKQAEEVFRGCQKFNAFVKIA